MNTARAENAYHTESKLDSDNSEGFPQRQSIRITLSSKGAIWPSDPRVPARVCLIHDEFPLSGFYRAHRIFSLKDLLMALQGYMPHKQFWDLIGESCLMKPRTSLVEENLVNIEPPDP